MSKLNARSPFYLNYSTPTEPTVAYDCTVANLTGFSVDQEGVVTTPNIERGTFRSFTSSAGDFANGKFATVSTDTSRTISVVIGIPTGYSNSSDGTFTCTATATQIAKVTSGSTPSCTGGPTLNGSISTQTIASGGNTATINAASFFNSATKYSVVNMNPALFNTSLSSSTLTITSGNSGGSGSAYLRANDDGVNTCTAVQRIPVTVTVSDALGCTASSGVTAVDLQGGSATAAGVVTEPSLTGGLIASFSLDASGSPTITSLSANSGSAAQNVTVYFNITVGAGFSNSGATIVCPKVISQAGTGLPTFNCDVAGIEGQGIRKDGNVIVGTAKVGTITNYTLIGQTGKTFPEVTSETDRNVSFEITPPAGVYASDSAITCPDSSGITLKQPAVATRCGSVVYYINTNGEGGEDFFCQGGFQYPRTYKILSEAVEILNAKGKTVCYANQSTNAPEGPFLGGGRYFAVDIFVNRTFISLQALNADFFNTFIIWKIDDGVVSEVWQWNCSSGGNGQGRQIQ
jgi:hypothetical protein